MTDVDQLRADLYRDTGAFVASLQGKDRSDPKLRDEALVRVQGASRHATIDGRRRFLDAMKCPGADQDRRRPFDVCRKSGKDEPTCRAYAAPITNLIGTYDPANPPSDALKDWHDTLRADDPELAALLEGAEPALPGLEWAGDWCACPVNLIRGLPGSGMRL